MTDALAISLSAAVPLLILEMQRDGGPTDEDHAWLREYAASNELPERADVLQFGGKPGEAAKLFNNLARATAIMAFCPGGVKAFGNHWEGNPLQEPETKATSVESQRDTARNLVSGLAVAYHGARRTGQAFDYQEDCVIGNGSGWVGESRNNGASFALLASVGPNDSPLDVLAKADALFKLRGIRDPEALAIGATLQARLADAGESPQVPQDRVPETDKEILQGDAGDEVSDDPGGRSEAGRVQGSFFD